ncbi:unnamed protein product, partial [Symbiodinium sp. CCMP2592]
VSRIKIQLKAHTEQGDWICLCPGKPGNTGVFLDMNLCHGSPPLWWCEVDPRTIGEYHYIWRKSDGSTLQEKEARTLDAILPHSLGVDDGWFREPVCDRHTTADSGGIWNMFSSLLGTSQKDLENKLNERIHLKVTPLETSLRRLSMQCSAQAERISTLETRLQDATEELQVMMESRLTSQQNRSDRELRDVKRSLDSVLVPDEMLSKFSAGLKQDLDVEVSRLRSHLATLEAHLADVMPTWTFSGSDAGREDIGKDIPSLERSETGGPACDSSRLAAVCTIDHSDDSLGETSMLHVEPSVDIPATSGESSVDRTRRSSAGAGPTTASRDPLASATLGSSTHADSGNRPVLATTRTPLLDSNGAIFSKPPHPADPESRRITLELEKELVASRSKPPEEKRKFLKSLYLRVHPDKGAPASAMEWLTAWQEIHQEWYMTDLQFNG